MSMQIKVLFLAANPLNTQRLLIDEENRAIKMALAQTPYRERFNFKEEWAIRVSDLQAIFFRYKPHIVHFSGHGDSQGELILADEMRNGIAVSGQILGRLFSTLKDDIHCVILNACYSEPQANIIAEHVDYVIGTPGLIGDESAIKFSSGFYLALGHGKELKPAFDAGCLQIALENRDAQSPKFINQLTSPWSIASALQIGKDKHDELDRQLHIKIHQDIEESDNVAALRTRKFEHGSVHVVQKITKSNNIDGVVVDV